MKLASFIHAGRAGYGVVDGARYRLAPDAFVQRHQDLAAVLLAGALDDLAAATAGDVRTVSAAETTALPVLLAPSKLICVGLNYKNHVAEMKRADSAYPALFVRFADTLAADGDVVRRPSFSELFDWEGELAVVIGKAGRGIAESDAFDHVAGYCNFNDISVRDFQRHTHQWTAGKNFPGTGPLGPWLVTRDEVPDVNALTLETRLNGEVMQHASVSDLIFTVPVLIAYISQFTLLRPGDVIATGTPGGVGSGRTPPKWMKDGDTVEVEITGLGVLRNTIGTDRDTTRQETS